MPYIYLMRHGKPDFPGNVKLCIGRRTDLPICKEGIQQALQWKDCFLQCDTIYHSNLKRSKMTAQYMANGRRLKEVCDFQELETGQWDGKKFDDLKVLYPDIYAAKQTDWSANIPDGESLEDCADRVLKALESIIKTENRDMIVVTHAGVIRSVAKRLLNLDPKKDPMPKQEYGGVMALEYENGNFDVLSQAHGPYDWPCEKEINSFCRRYQIPYDVIDTSRKKADLASKTNNLKENQDIQKLYTAVLLQGLSEFCREKYKTDILRNAGYPHMSDIVKSNFCSSIN